MPVTKIRSRWTNGALEFYDEASGNSILRLDVTDKLGFFGATPVAQQADIGALTDNTGGTADNTLQAISASYVQAEIQNNFADLASQVNDIRTVLRNLGLMA
jgi:hypothetical protein